MYDAMLVQEPEALEHLRHQRSLEGQGQLMTGLEVMDVIAQVMLTQRHRQVTIVEIFINSLRKKRHNRLIFNTLRFRQNFGHCTDDITDFS